LWSDAKVEQKAVLIFENIFYLKPEYLPKMTFEGGNIISGANFCIVFHSNYGPILLSFRDMTTGRTTDGRMLASIAYLTLKADQQ